MIVSKNLEPFWDGATVVNPVVLQEKWLNSLTWCSTSSYTAIHVHTRPYPLRSFRSPNPRRSETNRRTSSLPFSPKNGRGPFFRGDQPGPKNPASAGPPGPGPLSPEEGRRSDAPLSGIHRDMRMERIRERERESKKPSFSAVYTGA